MRAQSFCNQEVSVSVCLCLSVCVGVASLPLYGMCTLKIAYFKTISKPQCCPVLLPSGKLRLKPWSLGVLGHGRARTASCPSWCRRSSLAVRGHVSRHPASWRRLLRFSHLPCRPSWGWASWRHPWPAGRAFPSGSWSRAPPPAPPRK